MENSPQLWNKIWGFNPFYLPATHPLEMFCRQMFHFPAIKSLLGSFSLKNKDIIELGCGTGNNSLYLARHHITHSVTLVDFSPSALARVRKNKFPCKFTKKQEDILAFQPPQQYDFVHSAGLVEHFTGEQRSQAIRLHADCAKSGGMVMIWVPVHSIAMIFIGLINRLIGIQEMLFTEKELRELITKNGLKIIRENRAIGGAIFGVLAIKQ